MRHSCWILACALAAVATTIGLGLVSCSDAAAGKLEVTYYYLPG